MDLLQIVGSGALIGGIVMGLLKGGPRILGWWSEWRAARRADSAESREAVKAIWAGFDKKLELAKADGNKEKTAQIREEYAAHISAWQKERNWELREFAGFNPESQEERAPPPQEDEDSARVGLYQRNEGFFLIHVWRPSSREGQVADIAITLYHHPDGSIPKGRVRQVTYELGRKFFDGPKVMTNEGESFRLEVSAYDSMLCLARVDFWDGTPTLELHRYIDFPKNQLLQDIAWEREAEEMAKAEAAAMSQRGV